MNRIQKGNKIFMQKHINYDGLRARNTIKRMSVGNGLYLTVVSSQEDGTQLVLDNCELSGAYKCSGSI